METRLNATDRRRIKESIHRKYAEVAVSPEGHFRYPTGRNGLETLKYGTELIRQLPESVISTYCGVGNPFTLGPIHEGEWILDIGCGCGVDTLIAANMVGPLGKAVGVDLVPDMLARAEENLRRTGIENVSFERASAENLPFSDEGFHAIISNGAFSLIPNKAKALAEAFRVLKPRGRLMIADQILVGKLPEEKEARVDSWFK